MLKFLPPIIFLLTIYIPLVGQPQVNRCDSLSFLVDTYETHLNGNLDSAVYFIDRAIEMAGECDEKEEEIKLTIRKSDFLSGRGKQEDALATNAIAMSKASALGDSLLVGRVYIDLVRIMDLISEYDSALLLLNVAEGYIKPYGNTIYWEDVLAYRGIVYDKSGIYDKALLNYLEALEVAESRGDTSEIPGLLNDIAIVYKRQEDLESARKYYYQSLEISKSLQDERSAAVTNVNVGLLEKDLNNFDRADSLLNASLRFFEEDKMSYGVAVVLHNLAELKRKEGKVPEALSYYKRSQEFAIQNSYKQISAKNNLSLAELSFSQGKIMLALNHAEQALKIAEEQNLLEEACNVSKVLADIYEVLEQPNKALVAYKKYHQLNDSLYNDHKTEIISQLKTKYETQQKDAEIDVLKKEQALQDSEIRASAKQRRFLLILSIALVIIFILLATGFFETRKFNKQLSLRNNEIVRQNEFIESKQKELMSQHEALQKLSKSKDDLINIVAHDLRSPLNQVKGLIAILKMELHQVLTPDTNNYFDKIDISINTLRDRINRILDVEQINSDNVRMVFEPIDPAKILENIRSDFEGEAAKKGINISTSILEEVSDFIKADYNYTIQVLENLVSNAIKFSKSGEDIMLAATQTKDHIRLHVKDQGPGLTAEDQQNLFQKFTRLSAKPTGNEKSIGLGLAIVKKYMENMNGKVWCESEIGAGSEFIVEFEMA